MNRVLEIKRKLNVTLVEKIKLVLQEKYKFEQSDLPKSTEL